MAFRLTDSVSSRRLLFHCFFKRRVAQSLPENLYGTGYDQLRGDELRYEETNLVTAFELYLAGGPQVAGANLMRRFNMYLIELIGMPFWGLYRVYHRSSARTHYRRAKRHYAKGKKSWAAYKDHGRAIGWHRLPRPVTNNKGSELEQMRKQLLGLQRQLANGKRPVAENHGAQQYRTPQRKKRARNVPLNGHARNA